MVSRAEKKAAAEARAAEIYRRLIALKPDNLTERQWTIRAGVSPSFFTNLNGDKKSEPSVGNLRAVLGVIDVSLPEFFADEANGRLAPVPNRQALEQALRDALPDMPRSQAQRVEYLASTVAELLALPEGRRAKERTAA